MTARARGPRTRSWWGPAAVVVGLVAVAGLVAGCEEGGGSLADGTTVTVEGDAAAAVAAAAPPTSALGTVALLAVKGRAPKTGYTRDQFGPAWQDVDHNG